MFYIPQLLASFFFGSNYLLLITVVGQSNRLSLGLNCDIIFSRGCFYESYVVILLSGRTYKNSHNYMIGHTLSRIIYKWPQNHFFPFVTRNCLMHLFRWSNGKGSSSSLKMNSLTGLTISPTIKEIRKSFFILFYFFSIKF